MLLVHQEANNSLYPDQKKSLSSSLTFLQDVISCSSAEEMLPSWGVLVSCYFIALRGNNRWFQRKRKDVKMAREQQKHLYYFSTPGYL